MMRGHGEEGFTLPELLMAIAILAIIIAPLTLAFVTGLRVVGKTEQKFTDSRGALISAADFSNDVANATVVTKGAAGSPCGGTSTGAVLLTLAWPDATIYQQGTAPSATKRVSYVYDASGKRLLRRSCVTGPMSESVAAVSLDDTPPVVTCYSVANTENSTCNTDVTQGAVTRWVKLDVTAARNSPTPDNPTPEQFMFSLEGTRRAS